MPPESVIVPPPPVIKQGEQVDNSPGMEQVQRAFDRAYPDTTHRSEDKDQKSEVRNQPETPPAPESAPPPPPAAEPPVEGKLPNFLEEALRVETGQEKPAPVEKPVDEEWPEELPQTEKQSRVKGLRDAYKKLKGEVETLRTRPAQDEATTARLQQLERQNQEMGQVLTRMGVETHQEFQRNVIQPMTAAWQQAASIVKDAGGDPQELARAVTLQGKAHFEALDEVFEGLPESAKLEAHQAIANYKRMDQVRQQALANAPKTFEALHKKDLERQYQNVTEQRNEMKKLFQEAGRKLREVAKVEVLQKSEDPDAAWWNKQAEEIEQNASNLYMENTDMEKMAYATWLAPMADVYRKLWITERLAHQKTAKNLKEHFGAEPYIGQSGGGEGANQMEEDLKRPFSQVFLREFHRARERNR
jgi:hypothetical protein